MFQYYIGPSVEQPGNFFPSNIQGECHSFGALRAVRIVTQTSYVAHDRDQTSEKLLRVGRKAPEKFMHPKNSPLRPPFPPTSLTHKPIF